jgi:antitoxin VapB
MRNSTPQSQSASSRQTTTVFTSGNSQAVRLPKAFRFDAKVVEIERRGDEVILRAKRQTVGDILKHLPPLSTKGREAWRQVQALIDDPQPQERDWTALLGPAQAEPVTVKPAASRGTRKKTLSK